MGKIFTEYKTKTIFCNSYITVKIQLVYVYIYYMKQISIVEHYFSMNTQVELLHYH